MTVSSVRSAENCVSVGPTVEVKGGVFVVSTSPGTVDMGILFPVSVLFETAGHQGNDHKKRKANSSFVIQFSSLLSVDDEIFFSLYKLHCGFINNTI